MLFHTHIVFYYTYYTHSATTSQHKQAFNEWYNRRYHRLRAEDIAASQRHAAEQMRRHGPQFLNVGAQDGDAFCNKVLSLDLENLPHANLKLYDTAKFHVPNTNQELPPLQAIKAYKGLVKCYVGVSAQLPRKARPLMQVAKYLYGGSKQLAIEDGWEWHYLLDVIDQDFEIRLYNAGWAERKLHLFMRTLPNVRVVWRNDEPAPIFGENSCAIPDNGFIGLYFCLQFVE
jgi:hypothetical protein